MENENYAFQIKYVFCACVSYFVYFYTKFYTWECVKIKLLRLHIFNFYFKAVGFREKKKKWTTIINLHKRVRQIMMQARS